jgi:hypothetical protein
MDETMLALGRVAYERWVEGNEGVFNGWGLPPWINAKEPGFELSQEQKELWARVAVAARVEAYLEGMAHGRQVKITGKMIDAFGDAWHAPRRGLLTIGVRRAAGLTAALKVAGLEVIE